MFLVFLNIETRTITPLPWLDQWPPMDRDKLLTVHGPIPSNILANSIMHYYMLEIFSTHTVVIVISKFQLLPWESELSFMENSVMLWLGKTSLSKQFECNITCIDFFFLGLPKIFMVVRLQLGFHWWEHFSIFSIWRSFLFLIMLIR